MPTVVQVLTGWEPLAEGNLKPPDTVRDHQEQFAPDGFVSVEWFALVHTPIPISKAMRILKAKEAVGHEWSKLNKIEAGLYGTVQEKKHVMAEANRLGKKCISGHVWTYAVRNMASCLRTSDDIKDV